MTGGAAPGGPTHDGPAPAAGRPAAVVDARGRRCPIPIIELARRIGDVEVGGIIELLADDPAAAADVAAWCRMRGHDLLTATAPGPTAPGAASYLVRRRG
ncbi:sulfurtransferase TusA family protein [Parafrankia discariae]|uniref:sulfurtransferase TusA family protein n=1 Tax=Parafrankia discariae TaxID=365528 RepID=UPI0003AAFBBF|nr:sulfurtransferase TusA family protein [Parafrankia discariae]